jgi:uncharacterized protein YjbJ (UPF0337 family)
MNTLSVKGHLNIAKGKLKQKLGLLVDDDIQFMEGKQNELLGRIQKRKAQEISGHVPDSCTCSACLHPAK